MSVGTAVGGAAIVVREAAAPRVRLSLTAWAVARGALDGALAPVAVSELAGAGLLVRRDGGALVVDPAFSVAVRAWTRAPVCLDAVVEEGSVQVHTGAGIDPPLAVCVTRSRREGVDLNAVDVVLPGLSGVVGTVIGTVPPGGDGVPRSLWLRVRGPRGSLVDRVVDAGSGWSRPLPAVRRDVTRAVTAAVDELVGGPWR